MQLTLAEKTLISHIAKKVRKRLCDIHAGGFYDDELPYICYEASEALQIALWNKGIHAVIVQGLCDNSIHYWLEYKDHIIDLTASQFLDFPLIVFDHKDNLPRWKEESYCF